ncbi:RNA-binding protein PNO1 [Spironucleus salmonicida]|uniref:RNA-binding protein PNO1 n=1 Tax=Spironucleus salmonicida TaxID=348837 RepID=V6LKM2_9EUKA|nr:RNA-binding protein PNO1 [Spironucleus salmonicida]KAH0571976.1 RNA-binding protein PNO1 [Spironucleus salmonicida]|eukprot:EST44908.1 RNA-binding protein PNO1 [Spironucleus salmonicida]
MSMQFIQVPIAPNRISALKRQWKDIATKITTMHLDIRFNFQLKCVEIRTNDKTEDPKSIERSKQYIEAINQGFMAPDAAALLSFDDVFIESFEPGDVKISLKGDSLERALGRIAGQGGKVKNTIENATKTRIVIMGKKISVLGTPQCVKCARGAICDLILGSDASKVYMRLQGINDRFQK